MGRVRLGWGLVTCFLVGCSTGDLFSPSEPPGTGTPGPTGTATPTPTPNPYFEDKVIGIATGEFTGASTTVDVTGLGFAPTLVLLNRSNGFTVTHIAIEGVTSAFMSLGADGFSVDPNSQTNADGLPTYYLALDLTDFPAAAGTFTGDGQFSQAISGLGFRPALVIVHLEAAPIAYTHFSTAVMPEGSSLDFLTGDYKTDAIVALDDDGFSVGTGVNYDGAVYSYLALPAHEQVVVGSYVGTAEWIWLPTANAAAAAFAKGPEDGDPDGSDSDPIALWVPALGLNSAFEGMAPRSDAIWGNIDPAPRGVSIGGEWSVNQAGEDFTWFGLLEAE